MGPTSLRQRGIALSRGSGSGGSHTFAEQYLLEPPGITDFRWSGGAAKNPPGAYGMHLTPRDMAKLGYLYLRKGQWDGQQIVSSEWVEKATQKRTDVDVDLHFGYGYHWFTVLGMEGYKGENPCAVSTMTCPRS